MWWRSSSPPPIDWAIPRIMPGNPVQLYLSKFSVTTEAQYAALQKLISASFGVNVPVWKQYLDFWDGVLHWNFGLSFYATEPVTHVIFQAIPYTLALLIPAITLSYILGNRIGAMAARRKWLDNTVLPGRLSVPGRPLRLVGVGHGLLLGCPLSLVPGR